MTLKSFYIFNSGFDFKVYCLDNSKDKFKEYFDKFNFENLEFINFKDGTKWHNYLEHIKNDELTDLERKICLFQIQNSTYLILMFVFLN